MTSELHENLWRFSSKAATDISVFDGDLDADLVVIGGGYTGLSAALEASCRGASVVALDANTVGHGGSGRNVGLVNAGLWVPPEEIKAHLGDEDGDRLIDALAVAPDAVFNNIDTYNIDCEATRNGTLHLAHSPSGLKDLQERFRQGRLTGAPLQLLDGAETERRTGSSAFHGALFDPRAGTVQPLGYCRGLARAAKDNGALIFVKSPATEVVRKSGDWIVKSNGHIVRAKKLLVATNGYSVAHPGMPKPAFVPVHYSQFATAPLSKEQLAHILPNGEGCWDTAMVMSSIRIDKAGRMIIGGVGNSSGPGGAIHRRWAAKQLAFFYPELANCEFEYEWEGKIAMTSDHLPKVVAFAPDALSVFGYSGRGIGPGTVFGKCAAAALLFDEVDKLPVPKLSSYSEPFQKPRAAYYEFGATMMHVVTPKPLISPKPKL